jgi:hypothetical protein
MILVEGNLTYLKTAFEAMACIEETTYSVVA